MTTYPTDTHTPAASAPTVTDWYAVCKVCGMQWQVQSATLTDAKSCPFCGAGKENVSVHYEGT